MRGWILLALCLIGGCSAEKQVASDNAKITGLTGQIATGTNGARQDIASGLGKLALIQGAPVAIAGVITSAATDFGNADKLLATIVTVDIPELNTTASDEQASADAAIAQAND